MVVMMEAAEAAPPHVQKVVEAVVGMQVAVVFQATAVGS